MPSEFSRALVWLRRDLRLSDHRALAEATRRADSVAVAFVYDTEILDSLPRDDRRLTFIQASLDEVDRGLRAQGSRLLARHGNPLEVIPSLAREVGAEAVFFSHDDDPYALARDAEIPNRLPGVEVVSLKDHLIFERREV
ncbi:MAG: deoxyribodipyrimidine photo-lyase, partial [Fimbriimonadaceae bacterium]|nr:deoxyribodipyrimidine photo-lyase [Fimbriimonadaceae bacterium]